MSEQPFDASDAPAEVVARICASGPSQWDELDPGVAQLGVAKLRLAGVYDDRQEGWFMLRTRVPGGQLSAEQAEVVATVLCDFALRPPQPPGEPAALWDEAPDRTAEITTRQDLQLHWIRFEDLPEIWRRYDAVGLTTLEACGDTLRNVTTCPVAGLDPTEWIDARPIVGQVTRLALDEPALTAGLPRKFKVAVTGCATDCVAARLHDLAFTPARRDGMLGFNVWAGGGLSDSPRLASPLAMFVVPEQVADTVRAALALYRERGDAEHKAVNRFRMLVHQLGPDVVARELRRRLPFETAEAGEDLSTWRHEDHLGVHTARDGGRFVGLCVPLGRLSDGDLEQVARLARVHGDGGIRLTQRQNLVLTGLADPSGLLREPLLERLRPEPDPFERAVLACTGAPFCKFGVVNSKAVAAEIIQTLRARVPRAAWERLEGLRIHVSGCKASCAQTHAAHIGLRGTAASEGDGHVEAADLAVGGDTSAGRLARWAVPEIPVSRLADIVAAALTRARDPGAITVGLARAVVSEEGIRAG